MTYSLVVRDAATGQFGVAVQSHYFSVGSVVPWAQPGVGAVATQSFVEISYGPNGLARMASGESAVDALAALVVADGGGLNRQVAMVDGKGRAAAHTGANCIEFAGHIVGDGWTVEANMMRHPGVPEAMAESLTTNAEVPLPDRLLAALDAAEAAGGDVRGQQSVALVTVPPEGEAWRRLVDLRVEDAVDPLGEMRRLLALHQAYNEDGDPSVLGENFELAFWAMVGKAKAGHLDDARAMLRAATVTEPGWAELLKRLPAAGLWPEGAGSIAELLA